ncbi:MAG TPA: glycosyltransferase family 9 protein [Gemmatimonadaceae bacterium]|nr:glycosyltransferase family 9 protein [Gemmatimonadaceae bacterium]
MTTESDGVNDAAFRTLPKRWLAHTSEFVAPLLRVGATMASRGATSEPGTWRKGLIIGHHHIGDVLYRTCSLEKLAASLPQCEWSYLVSPQTAELLSGNPAVKEALPWNKGENSWELEDGKFGELRRRDFDVVLCTNTLRHYPDLALSVALGIPNRIAFSYKGLSGLITRASPIEFPSPYASYFRRMVADVAGIAPDWSLRPRVYPREEDHSAAARAFDELGFGETSEIVACSLTTRQAAGNWPRSHLLAALEAAHAERSFEVVLTGGPADSAELAAAARELSFPVKILAGGLGLRAFSAFLSRCSALLTLDSGPRHLGNAAGIPVLFARNLSHSRVEAGAYCDTEIDLGPAVEYLSDSETKRVVAGIPASRTGGALLNALASR